MFANNQNNNNTYFNSRYRTQSTTNMLSPDFSNTKLISRKEDRSSAILENSPKSEPFSLLRLSLPNDRDSSSSSDERFVMTIIRSPSACSQRALPPDSSVPTITTDEASLNNNFFKSKVTAALNHMKYRWGTKIRSNFRANESPIYLLGKMYNGKEEAIYDDTPRPSSVQTYSNFLKSFSQIIYFSYRKQFEPLTGSRNGDTITSDGGWGCMIRCAQMLLAQTLFMHMNNATCNAHCSNVQVSDRYSRLNSTDFFHNGNRQQRRVKTHTDIIRLFGDFSNSKCPFSIHKIVELGTSHGIRPGDFFGPVSAAYCLREALQAAVEAKQVSEMLRIYISQDAIIYREDVNSLCSTPSSSNNSSRWSTAALILVPMRLGLNEMDLVYEDSLKEALRLPQTVGIIGGSPRHAVYIVGFQDNTFINLDPHFIQPVVNVLDSSFDTTTYSCSSPKILTARKMDPNCTLGFYCRDKADFEMFCSRWNHACHVASANQRSCPIFRIERGTFQESHTRVLNCDFPLSNEDEDVFLRVTKLPSTTNSPSSSLTRLIHNPGRSPLVNSSIINPLYRDSWDDAGQSLHENNHRGHTHSVADDYVFL